jgi:pimeloyl-ACP methyl ester carboxylesterase
MKILFTDQSFSFELLRILGEAVYGGSDINECLQTAANIREGDCESWYQEWHRTAEHVQRIGEVCMARGHGTSAREALLRACNYHRCSEFFLHLDIGKEDPRAQSAYLQSIACFRKAIPYLPFPCEEVSIPYENGSLPGYFFRAGEGRRATLLVHSGFDGTMEEIYFGQVQAALERGYHCLAFEGPGQGRVIRLQRLPFRPDWEKVVTPVVDYALTRPEIDGDHLALKGGSMGGYLAPRAAAFEHRLAACIAVDGLFSFGPSDLGITGGAPLASLTEERIDAILRAKIQENLQWRWSIGQGMWAMQATSFLDLLNKIGQYTLEGIADQITCPTLVCDAEKDHFFDKQPKMLYDALQCPKTYMPFTTEDAAEEHCHTGASFLLNQRVFDWLDETLAARMPADRS